MKLLNWFVRFLDDLSPPRAAMDLTPAKPEPKSEPSCFALGIVRSIETEPEQWEVAEGDYRHTTNWTTDWISILSVKHRETGTRLEASTTYQRGPRWRLAGCHRIHEVSISGHALTDDEAALIGRTLEAHPLGQFKEIIDAETKEEARKAAAQARFEQLGCPSNL